MSDKVVVVLLFGLVGLIVVIADWVHNSVGRHNSRVTDEVVVILFLTLVVIVAIWMVDRCSRGATDKVVVVILLGLFALIVVVVGVSMVVWGFPSSAMTDKVVIVFLLS